MTEGQGNTNGRQGLTVALPVLFVDEWMPRLKDTELRVMLAVLRQTSVIGREAPTAWLTHSELRRRTGRAGEAVSFAVAQLVNQGLLEVLNETCDVLRTAESRQTAPGRRLYRVTALAGLEASGDSSRAGKPKTIESKDRYYSLRFSDVPQNRVYDSVDAHISQEERILIQAEKAKIREKFRQLGLNTAFAVDQITEAGFSRAIASECRPASKRSSRNGVQAPRIPRSST